MIVCYVFILNSAPFSNAFFLCLSRFLYLLTIQLSCCSSRCPYRCDRRIFHSRLLVVPWSVFGRWFTLLFSLKSLWYIGRNTAGLIRAGKNSPDANFDRISHSVWLEGPLQLPAFSLRFTNNFVIATVFFLKQRALLFCCCDTNPGARYLRVYLYTENIWRFSHMPETWVRLIHRGG